jgi:hypothetical protein
VIAFCTSVRMLVKNSGDGATVASTLSVASPTTSALTGSPPAPPMPVAYLMPSIEYCPA